MKFLSFVSLFVVVFSTAALADANVREIHVKSKKSVRADMTGYSAAKILVEAEKSEPVVTTERGPLAECILRDVQKVGGEFELSVEFDADLDDGLNCCQVFVEQPSGRKVHVLLFVDVET